MNRHAHFLVENASMATHVHLIKHHKTTMKSSNSIVLVLAIAHRIFVPTCTVLQIAPETTTVETKPLETLSIFRRPLILRDSKVAMNCNSWCEVRGFGMCERIRKFERISSNISICVSHSALGSHDDKHRRKATGKQVRISQT